MGVKRKWASGKSTATVQRQLALTWGLLACPVYLGLECLGHWSDAERGETEVKTLKR